MGDRFLGGLGLALAAFFIFQATRIQTSFISDPVGAKTFPIIIGVVFGISSLVILLRPDAPPKWPDRARFLELLLAAIVLVAYALLLQRIGFVIATALASGFLAWRLGARPLSSALAGVAIAIGIYAIFHLALGLTLAKGPFGF